MRVSIVFVPIEAMYTPRETNPNLSSRPYLGFFCFKSRRLEMETSMNAFGGLIIASIKFVKTRHRLPWLLVLRQVVM